MNPHPSRAAGRGLQPADPGVPGTGEWQYAAALTADGHFAAAGGWDGLVRLWDADAAKLRATLLHPPTAATTDWLIVVPSGVASASEPAISSTTATSSAFVSRNRPPAGRDGSIFNFTRVYSFQCRPG